MRNMNLGEGLLVLLGFLLILNALVFKISGLNLLPMIKNISSFFIAANTCFLVACISAVFGKSGE